MTTTAYFTIGNSDDKLTQFRWSAFVTRVHLAVDRAVSHGAVTEFCGYSAPAAPWQNAIWCVRLPDDGVRARLRVDLQKLAAAYEQDSIAWAEADTVEMLTADTPATAEGAR